MAKTISRTKQEDKLGAFVDMFIFAFVALVFLFYLFSLTQ
jgi:hypothetical protein